MGDPVDCSDAPEIDRFAFWVQLIGPRACLLPRQDLAALSQELIGRMLGEFIGYAVNIGVRIMQIRRAGLRFCMALK